MRRNNFIELNRIFSVRAAIGNGFLLVYLDFNTDKESLVNIIALQLYKRFEYNNV